MSGRLVDPNANPTPGDPDDKLVVSLFHRFGSELPPDAVQAVVQGAARALGQWAHAQGKRPRPHA